MVVNALKGDPEAAAAVLAWDKQSILGDTLQAAIYLCHLDLKPFLGAIVLLQEHPNGPFERMQNLRR